MNKNMNLKTIIISCTITGFIPVFLSGCGSSANEHTNAVTQIQSADVTETVTETTGISDPGVSYKLPRMIEIEEYIMAEIDKYKNPRVKT